MSYDKDLMANSSLRKAWRAANDQLSKSEYENINLPMVCEELDNWVASDSLNLRRSLSLSASSILVNGACRFYRDETDKLLKDASKLSQQIMLSHYQSDASSSEDDDESFDTDETREYKTEDTSNILQRKRSMETDNSSKQTKRVKLDAQSNSTKSNSDNDGSDHNLDGVVRGSTHLVEECNVPSNSNLEEQVLERETCKEKAGQTYNSLLRTTGHCNGVITGFGQNLPFGVMLTHDEYHSRIPSKTLSTSLNAAVKNLKIN